MPSSMPLHGAAQRQCCGLVRSLHAATSSLWHVRGMHALWTKKESHQFGCWDVQTTGKLEGVAIDDWTDATLPTWRHSNWVGVWDPWPVIAKLNPLIWYRVVREIVTLERMHRAFASGLMQYGMAKAVKREAPGGTAGATAAVQPAAVAA